MWQGDTMKLLTCALLLAALAILAMAADVSGTYSGTFKPEGENESGAFAHIKQTGSDITGTVGPAEDKQWTIAKGKIQGNKVTFEVQNPEGPLFKMDLTVEGDRISGDVSATAQNGSPMRARIDLAKVKN
jgi:hypothetical protein